MTPPARREEVENLGCGCLGGALAAVVGMAIFLVVLFVIEATPTNTQDWLGIGEFTLKFVAVAALFVSPFGTAAGLLIAFGDNLVDGRLHNARMPFWAWLPLGSALGAVSSVFLLGFLMGMESLATATLVGAACGLVAGPVFGLLYRQKRKDAA